MAYTLNRNSGIDTIHVEYPWEVCNTDEAEDLEKVDEATARALMEHGNAKPCEHCRPFAEGK